MCFGIQHNVRRYVQLAWVAVARVFALVVRCSVMRLLLYSRVGKNRDTRRESPAGAGADRTADHLTVLFSQKVLAVRRANCIYRPVVASITFFLNRFIHPALSFILILFCKSSSDLSQISKRPNQYSRSFKVIPLIESIALILNSRQFL